MCTLDVRAGEALHVVRTADRYSRAASITPQSLPLGMFLTL